MAGASIEAVAMLIGGAVAPRFERAERNGTGSEILRNVDQVLMKN